MKAELKKIFEEEMKDEKVRMHCIEVEAIMKSLARELGEDEEKWSATGLIHDLDYNNIDMKEHGKQTIEILKGKIEDDIKKAILSHNEENTGVKRESKLDFALSASDNISGLIFATALMMPDKKLSSVKINSVKKKLKDKYFAASVRRDLIYDVEKSGIKLDKFLEISLKAMQEISDELGL